VIGREAVYPLRARISPARHASVALNGRRYSRIVKVAGVGAITDGTPSALASRTTARAIDTVA
jgi:hypothetical protein